MGRLLLMAVLGAALVWLILTRTLAAYLAVAAPSTALILQPSEPTALVNLAELELKALLDAGGSRADRPAFGRQPAPYVADQDRLAAISRLAGQAMQDAPEATDAPLPTPGSTPASEASGPIAPLPPLPAAEAERIRALAVKVVAASPLNADAIGILARLADRSGDGARTEALMRTAVRLSIRESHAVYWLLRKAERENDDAAVVAYADTLLRTRSRTLLVVLPSLARIAERKDRSEALVAQLAADPSWRGSFLARLPDYITDARTPLYLLLALRGTAHPPTTSERAAYLRFLIRRKFPELAYYTWLQFQPPEDLARIGPLYNRSFEITPSGLPFDWTLSQGSGATAEVRPRPDLEGQHALVIEFGQGRVEFPGVTQLTLLAPGTYVLTGKFKGRLLGIRGLVWRSHCAGGTPLAQSEPLKGDIPDWRAFQVVFTVPETGCRAQQMRLDLDARSASETMVSGSLWFDDLDLRRGG